MALACLFGCGIGLLPLDGGPAKLSVSAGGGASFNYGFVPSGLTALHTFLVSNGGGRIASGLSPQPFTLPNFSFPGGYPGTGGTCGSSLDPGASCDLVVAFVPTVGDLYADQIGLSYSAGVASLALAGIGSGGGIDTTFAGGTGFRLDLFAANRLDWINAIAIETDGKIVLAGYHNSGSNREFLLVRLLTDGTLDSSFSTDGIVIDSAGSNNDILTALAIQSDGKIVVAGYSGNGVNDVYTLARYLPGDGSRDTTFGVGGMVTTAIHSTQNNIANALVIQPDGKLLVGGSSHDGVDEAFGLVRYLTDGAIDSSFDTDGIVLTPIYDLTECFALALYSDGRIVAAGLGHNPATDYAMARYLSNGSLDSSFDVDGIVTLQMSNEEQWNQVAVQADGKVVAAGKRGIGPGQTDMSIHRFLTGGSLDSTFGTGGLLQFDPGSVDYVSGLVLLPSGKLLFTGMVGNGAAFLVGRALTSGVLDSTFGSGGYSTFDFTVFNDVSTAVAIQSDGKIVVAGSQGVATGEDVGVVRFWP